MNERVKQLVTIALNEVTGKMPPGPGLKPRSVREASYRRFYNKVAQHLERQGYDDAEGDVRQIHKKDPNAALEAVKEMITDRKLLEHPAIDRAIHHLILGFDPNKAKH